MKRKIMAVTLTAAMLAGLAAVPVWAGQTGAVLGCTSSGILLDLSHGSVPGSGCLFQMDRPVGKSFLPRRQYSAPCVAVLPDQRWTEEADLDPDRVLLDDTGSPERSGFHPYV